jgi:hypothetical protein
MSRAALLCALVVGSLCLCAAASAQEATATAEPVPPPPQAPSEPALPETDPAAAEPGAPEEAAPAADKRPLRLYQTQDGVSVLSNKDPSEPAEPRDAAPPKPPPPEPRIAETTLEPTEVDPAPAPSERPVAPVAAAEPASRTPLFLLAAALGLVAIVIVGIFFRKK